MSVRSDRSVHGSRLVRSRHMSPRVTFLLVASALIALAGAPACGASVAVENRPCPCASGFTCCAEENVCVADGTSCSAAVPAGGFSTSAVSRAQSACAGASTAGALEQAPSAADATLTLAKGWIPCARDRWLADRGGDAVVFTGDGTWSLLKLDASGALAPLTGLGTHGSFALYGEGSSSPVEHTDSSAKKITGLGLVDDGAAPGAGTTARLDFEAGTARMRLSRSRSSPPEETWFAPLPGAASCDYETESDFNVPACFCSAACEQLGPRWRCGTDATASQCVAACKSATPAQRRGLTECMGAVLPPAAGSAPASTCEPSCFRTVGWDPSRGSGGSSDGGTGNPSADGGE